MGLSAHRGAGTRSVSSGRQRGVRRRLSHTAPVSGPAGGIELIADQKAHADQIDPALEDDRAQQRRGGGYSHDQERRLSSVAMGRAAMKRDIPLMDQCDGHGFDLPRPGLKERWAANRTQNLPDFRNRSDALVVTRR